MLFITWAFFCVIFLAAYTSNLTATLTVAQLGTSISSLVDLQRGGGLFGAPAGSSIIAYFEHTVDAVVASLVPRMVAYDDADAAVADVRAGKLVVIGATAESGLASVKDVALISADHPSAMVTGWSGMFAPAGTPADVVTRLEQALRAALSDPVVLGMLNNVGMSPSSSVTHDAFVRTVDMDYRRFGAIIKTRGIELQ